jgi:AcrR family transcriptional regulator
MASGSLALVPSGSGLPGSAPVPARRLTDTRLTDQRRRLVEAALSCIARFGLAKTTLDDVARTAGCSRATLYRAFPGGKEALLQAVVDTEVARLFSQLALSMGEAEDLEEVLVAGMVGAARAVSGHGALGFLLAHEPEVVLPHLAFEHHDRLLEVAAGFAAPFLERWLDDDEAVRLSQWAARIVLSYLVCPAEGVDPSDPADVRWLVRSFVLPAAGCGSSGQLAGRPAPSPARGRHLTMSVAGHLTESKGEAP